MKIKKTMFLVINQQTIVSTRLLYTTYDAAGNVDSISMMLPQNVIEKLNISKDNKEKLLEDIGEVCLDFDNEGIHHVFSSIKKAIKWAEKLRTFDDHITYEEILEQCLNRKELTPGTSREVFAPVETR